MRIRLLDPYGLRRLDPAVYAHPSVDDEHLSSYEARLRGGQEGNCIRNVRGGCQPSQRNARQNDILPNGAVGKGCHNKWRPGVSWSDSVDTDPLCRPFNSQCSRERINTPLRGRILEASRQCDLSCHGREIHDRSGLRLAEIREDGP